MTEPTRHRALVALDLAGVPRILATDSALIAFDVSEVSTDAEDVGLCRARDVGPGLWLWEGSIHTVDMSAPDMPAEYEPDYRGTLRAVVSGVEAADLFTMTAPEPEYDDSQDRDPPGA